VNKELLTLFSRLSFQSGGTPSVDPAHVAIFNTEIATLGYTFGPDVLAKMHTLTDGDFTKLRKRVLDLLVELTGVSKNHQTLFARFPHSTPEQHQYLLSRVIGYLQDQFDLAPASATVLSCGHAIDHRLFDLTEFGACPICQQQVDELRGNMPEVSNVPFARFTPLKVIGYADRAFIEDAGSKLLARNSSLSETEKTFLRLISDKVILVMPETVFRETLPFVYKTFGLTNTVRMLSGATDVLRILAHVSGSDNDLSLATGPKLKLSRKTIRHAMIMLEHLAEKGDLDEDLYRHIEPWKRFARHAHVGAERTRKAFPKAKAAFDTLIDRPRSIMTFGRSTECLIRARSISPLAETMIARPGEFMRKLDFMLRNGSEADHHNVLAALSMIVPKVTTKLLFEVKKYLEHRDGATGQRVYLPKGNANRVQIKHDWRRAIRDEHLLDAISIIENELLARLSKREPMGKVFLDEGLRKVMMPFNRRGDSATTTPVGKGSAFKLSDEAEVVRLFIHWTGDDVDLSALLLDETFNVIQQVSWTNLSGLGMAHSGDITSAPDGASEFIDIDLKTIAKKSRARYIAMSVISYTGTTFDTFPCFAGFMERDGLKSGKVFEPEATTLKFDMSGRTKSYMPLMFDVVEREVVWVDLTTGGSTYSAVEGQTEKFQALTRMAADLPNTKPTAFDVLKLNAQARGTLVRTPDEADIVYRREGVDLEHVMSLTA
jgi:hypothetical protein